MALLLAGCASVPMTAPPAVNTTPQPLAHMMVATPDVEHDLIAQLLAGEMALTHSDLAAASGHYARAMAVSRDPQVAERAVQLALAVHDQATARRALARWQALGASVAQLAQARAALALDSGDGAEAKVQLQRLLASGDQDAWRKFARVLAGARDQAQAARLLEALATPQRLPGDVKAWLAMSELGDKLGRGAYALTVAEAAVARFDDAEAAAWAAHLKFNQGDRAGASALLRQAIARAPDDVQLRLAYAGLLAQAKDFAQARRVLERGPQTAQTYELRAALAAQQKDSKALATIYRQLRASPSDVREASAYLLGQLAEMQHRPDDALAWYQQVGDDDAHAFDAGLRSALILFGQGHGSEAHQLLEQLQLAALEQPEQLREAYQADAELYLREQKYPQAEAAFSRALQVVPDDSTLLYGRGLAYAQAGNVDMAIKDFRRVLSLKPDDVDASNALGFTLADANRDLAEAERLLRMARDARPDDPSIADSWGWLQYRQGHLQSAAQTLRQAWKANRDAEIGIHLGEVLAKLGQIKDAREVFAQVRKLDPHNPALSATLRRLQL